MIFQVVSDMPLLDKTKKVVSEFRKIHGDRYDYSLVKYQGSQTKVKIICEKHGEFLQTPNAHKNGKGCCKCKVEANTLTQEEVIKKFKEVHKDKYDYSLVEYKGNSTKVKIICKRHGEFLQEPRNHKTGVGCHKCKVEASTLTQEEVIEQFREVHGNKYDYSEVKYINTYSKVKIICEKHGEFLQEPYSHKRNYGCPHALTPLKAK